MSVPQPQRPAPADQVRQLYHLQPTPGSWQFLGNAGGFSGAQFWRFAEPDVGDLVLRIWPAGTELNRIRWIHAALRHLAAHGVSFVPVPLVHQRHDSVFLLDGRPAELAPWLRGRPDFQARPTPVRLQNAMRALAQIHVALATFESHPPGVAPGMRIRLDRWRALSSSNQLLPRLLQVAPSPANRGLVRFVPELAQSVARVRESLSARLESAAQHVVPLQVCLRDIWHDHLLFVDDCVTGVVDFDALRVDSVCLDVVRLGQSLIGNDGSGWQMALAAYQELRPLTELELDMHRDLRMVNPILVVASWLDWGLLEGRPFEHPSSVLQRLEFWRNLLP